MSIAIQQKIPFGEKDGRMYAITEVESGAACGCICSHCKKPLIARKGDGMPHHFAHAPGADACPGGCQTAIHKMAIQIVSDNKTIILPAYNRQPVLLDLAQTEHKGEKVEIPTRIIKFDRTENEYHCGDFIVDVTGFTDIHMTHIEIKVTHAVDNEKVSKVRNKHENMIEIDLSSLDHDIVRDLEQFKQEVLFNSNNRIWIVHTQCDHLYQETKRTLRERIKQINKDLKPRLEKIRLEKLKQEQHMLKRQKNFESNRKNMRDQYYHEISMLNRSFQPDWRQSREEELYASCRDSIKQLHNSHILPDYLNLMVKNDWFVMAHRSEWQYDLVNRFIFGKKGMILDVGKITDWLIEKTGLQDWAMRLHLLKKEQKLTGKKRGKLYGDYGAWFLAPYENDAIPHPFAICIAYIKTLHHIGLVKKVDDYKFQVMVDSDKEYDKIRQKRALINEKYLNHYNKKTDESVAKDKKEKEATRAKKKLHILAIVHSANKVLTENDGLGSQCQQCLITAKRGIIQRCPCCGASEYRDIAITQSHLDTAAKRYFCKPQLSKIVQELDLDYTYWDDFFE